MGGKGNDNPPPEQPMYVNPAAKQDLSVKANFTGTDPLVPLGTDQQQTAQNPVQNTGFEPPPAQTLAPPEFAATTNLSGLGDKLVSGLAGTGAMEITDPEETDATKAKTTAAPKTTGQY